MLFIRRKLLFDYHLTLTIKLTERSGDSLSSTAAVAIATFNLLEKRTWVTPGALGCGSHAKVSSHQQLFQRCY